VLAGCIRGNHGAWQAFVDRYARVIHTAVQGVLSRGSPGRQDVHAEDITQEVFLRLVRDDFRLLRLFDPTRASLVTYLTIISRSTTLDRVRRRYLKTVPLNVMADQTAQPPEPLRSIQIPPDLLSPRQQLVLQMLFDRQMTVSDAAKALGVDAQTVRSTKHKAISKLRQYFVPK